MGKYIKYFKRSFEPLHLNNETELNSRASHPLELFFDLVFVVALSKVGHVFLHPNLMDIFKATILFLAIYQVWKNITNFNAFFFKHSLVVSFLFLITMIPIFFITSITDYQDSNNIYLLIISFSLSRLVLALAWYKIIYKNENITNKFINNIAFYLSLMFITSSLTLLLSLLNYELFYIYLLFTVVFEIILTYVIPYKVSKIKDIKVPKMDNSLLQERRVLFIILVWGEALVTAGSVFGEYESFLKAVIMSLVLFLIIGLFFLRAVQALGDTYNYKHMSFAMLEFTDYTFPLITLSLFVSLAGIAPNEKIDLISRAIVVVDLIYINTSHLVANIGVYKKPKVSNNFKDFIALDNILLIIQLIITIFLIFITNSTIFIFLILIIFILHFLAVPIRNGETEYF